MLDLTYETKQMLPNYPVPRLEIYDPKNKRRAQVLELWNSGEHDTYKIAKKLNTTRGKVYNDLRGLGIKNRVKAKKKRASVMVDVDSQSQSQTQAQPSGQPETKPTSQPQLTESNNQSIG